MKKMVFVLLFILSLGVMTTEAEVQSSVYRMNYDGAERIVNLYVPQGKVNALMIVLHPIYSSGLAMEVITGLDKVADEQGWVLAYANSLHPYWDDGRVEAGIPPDFGTVDDTGFIDALAENLSNDYGVDSVFLVGMGNGGSMALRVACEKADHINAIVAVSVLMWEYQMNSCNEQANHKPIKTLFVYGNQDFIYKEDGREIQAALTDESWKINSASDTLNYWLNFNDCDPESETALQSLTIYNQCGDDTVTAFYTVPGGAGNWPRMGNNQLNRLGMDASDIIAAFLSGDENWYKLTQEEPIPDVIARNYILYVPQSYDPNTPTPVVLSLHGRYASMVSQARVSAFNDVADREGFIVLYPQAYDPKLKDPTWNYLKGILPAFSFPWDDEAFLDTLVDDLAQDLNIDMKRLYVTGLSNGGYMTNRLACTRSNRYAAFASVAGAAPFGIVDLCEKTTHSPFMLVQGTDDPISPWKGVVGPDPESGKPIYMVLPTDMTMGFWTDQNECTGKVERQDLASTDPDSSVSILSVGGCPNDAAVVLYAVVGGGHVWPGVFDYKDEQLGEVNMDYNASEKIWEFLSQYTLDGKVDS